MWLRTLLIALLVFFLVRFIARLARGVMEGAAGGATRRAPGTRAPVKMVADPVCGTYVIPGKALQSADGRETHYFCSEKCRDAWLAR
jgi:YHS domain-containing protein